MKNTAFTAAALLGLSVSAFAQAKVNYTDHILPIFRNACTNCHNPDKKKAGLDLTTYQDTMAGGEQGAAVKPGNADGSLLYKLAAHLDEPKMPPKGDKLSEADLKLVKEWIAGFALETANSKPAVAQANKVDSAVVSLTRPEGPAPMPGELPLEPFVKARPLGALTSLAVSPWAPLVAIGGQKQVFLYHVESLDPLGVLAFPEGFPQVLRFSKNAKLLLAAGGLGGKSGKVVLWDVATGDRIGSVGNEADAVLAADLSADQQFVALGGPDKRVKIYQTKDGKQTGLIKKHTEWITAIAYSPDGKYLGTADRNGGVEIWESAADPKPFNTLAGHKAAVTALAFMPGVLASGSEDGTIKLWNVKEGTESKSWNAHPGGVLSVDFTPDGRLVSCGRDKVAKVWDAAGKALATTEAFSDLATRAALNSERVIAADFTGAIRVFALADGKANKVGELTANPPGIAEQLAQSEKTAADTAAALPALEKAVADNEARVKSEREAADAKRKADLAAGEARKAEAQKQLDAAKGAPAEAEKALNALQAQLADAKAALAKAETNAAEKKKASALNDRSKMEAELASAEKNLAKLTVEISSRREARAKFTQGTPEYARADAEVQGIKPQIAAAEQALANAKAALANSGSAVLPAEVDAAKAAVTDAQKKVEALRQQTQQSQQAHGKVKAEAPKRIAEAEKALTAATTDLTKLQQSPVPAPAEAEKALAAAKTEFEAASKRLTASRAGVERWKRAQLYQTVFNARQNVSALQAKHEDLLAAAKDAFRPVELTKLALANAEQLINDAPKIVAQKEAALAEVRKNVDAMKAQLASAEKAVEDKKAEIPDMKKVEAEIAEATNKYDAIKAEENAIREERNKFQEGTPERAALQEKREAIRPKVAAAEAAVEAAKAKLTAKQGEKPIPAELIEAVKKAQLDAKLATDKLIPAEKALRETTQAIADAKKQIPELKARMPELEKEGAKTKADAESAAITTAKELEAAKAQFEKVRAQYESVKNATKPATTAQNKPVKQG